MKVLPNTVFHDIVIDLPAKVLNITKIFTVLINSLSI